MGDHRYLQDITGRFTPKTTQRLPFGTRIMRSA
jgi:hypothetical protein